MMSIVGIMGLLVNFNYVYKVSEFAFCGTNF